MKQITDIIKNLRNLFPYFLLIAIYFFFINLEARKTKKTNLNSDIDKILKNDESVIDPEKSRIVIPV